MYYFEYTRSGGSFRSHVEEPGLHPQPQPFPFRCTCGAELEAPHPPSYSGGDQIEDAICGRCEEKHLLVFADLTKRRTLPIKLRPKG